MDTVFELKHITKVFPGVRALDDVSLSFARGEVHALCGENGAGKSTLIKTMCGIYEPDGGEIWYRGKQTKISSPQDAINMGISVVHQEIKLAENLSIAENIYIGRPPLRKGMKLVNWKQLRKDAQELLYRLGIEMNVNTPVEKLSIAQKQIVEIAKAMSYNAEVIIMDEPSATLTEKELDALFRIIDLLREQKVTVIYISHRLEEVFRLADRVSVLRDGQYIGTKNIKDVTQQELITMMVNRPIGMEYPKIQAPLGEELLRVENLKWKDTVNDVSFCVHRGEILGLAGLVGAGRTESVRLIYGAEDRDGGKIFLDGKEITVKSPEAAVALGIGLVPEDRKGQGLVLGMDVRSNYSLAGIEQFVQGFLVNKKKESVSCQEYIDKLEIKTPTMRKLVGELSGGNQQKVVLARWLLVNSDVLIFDEPTRGIDVGAKNEIYQLLNDLCAQGKAIIMISSDLPELMGMSDRIVVISKGRSIGELQREEFNSDRILEMAIS